YFYRKHCGEVGTDSSFNANKVTAGGTFEFGVDNLAVEAHGWPDDETVIIYLSGFVDSSTQNRVGAHFRVEVTGEDTVKLIDDFGWGGLTIDVDQYETVYRVNYNTMDSS